jgi:hypothetical protein
MIKAIKKITSKCIGWNRPSIGNLRQVCYS